MSDKRLFYGLFGVVVLILMMTVLSVRQSANRTVAPASPTSSEPIQPSLTFVPALRDEPACKRLYEESSIWNIPIDWSVAKIHPMNDQMMDAFFRDYDWIGSDTSQYTPNIYWVSNQTPLVPVQLIKYRFRDAFDDVEVRYGEPGGIVWMPLPPNARPAAGTDGQLALINTDTGEEWGLNKGFVDFAGKWFAGGVYRYNIHNSGIPPEGFAQRGAGIGQLAGIVRRCEVQRGRIDHAVTIAYDYPCIPEVCQQNGWPAFVPPFRKTDGRGDAQYDIPEGARLAIRPEISRNEIQEACDGIRGCIIWALNMQEYGGFIVDNSDHPKTYGEGNPTANWEASEWSENMLNGIPTDWYIVIDWNYPSTKDPK
jgi:hypothetical protein